MADIWKSLSKDEKDVFRDPYFFAPANLPNLAKINLPGSEGGNGDDDEDDPDPADPDDLSFRHLEASTSAPEVHQLTDAKKMKYQPIFDRLVNVEKLHLCHGRPEPGQSVATAQKKSLAELRKAHHQVSTYELRLMANLELNSFALNSSL